MALGKSFSVHVPEKLDLAKSQAILASVLRKAGCPTCFSGIRVSFESEVESLKVSPGSTEVS